MCKRLCVDYKDMFTKNGKQRVTDCKHIILALLTLDRKENIEEEVGHIFNLKRSSVYYARNKTLDLLDDLEFKAKFIKAKRVFQRLKIIS